MEEDYINKIEGADLGNDNEISEVGDEDEGWGGRRELQLWRARFDRDKDENESESEIEKRPDGKDGTAIEVPFEEDREVGETEGCWMQLIRKAGLRNLG